MPTDDAAVPPTAPHGQPANESATPPAPAPDTGASGLEARLADLDQLAGRALAEHIEVYQGLHTELQAALAEIDSA